MGSLLLNINYILKAAGYAVYDVLKLRILLFSSQLFILAYAFTNIVKEIDITAMYSMIAWSGLFIALNGYQIVKLILERREIVLEPIMEMVYQRDFKGFTRREFRSVWQFGEQRDITDNQRIIEQNTSLDQMYYIVEGVCSVYRFDKEIAELYPGNFIGEMSYYSKDKASADVLGRQGTIIQSWHHDHLNKLQAENPSLWVKLQGVLCLDLINKLKQRGEERYRS